MKLTYTQTLEIFEAEIIEVAPADFIRIKRDTQFSFDWQMEKSNHVFQLIKIGEEDILGLISLIDIFTE